MTALSLIEEVRKMADEGAPINWRDLRDRIHNEHAASTSPHERGLLLALYNTIMDGAERNDVVAPENLENFRETRRQDYNLLLVTEATVDGNVSPRLLDEVTCREVAAGRMQPDNKLRELATAGLSVLEPSDATRGRAARVL